MANVFVKIGAKNIAIKKIENSENTFFFKFLGRNNAKNDRVKRKGLTFERGVQFIRFSPFAGAILKSIFNETATISFIHIF